MSAATTAIERSAQPIELPAALTDERSATISVGRLLLAGSAAAVMAFAPLLFTVVCQDAPWYVLGCWGR